MEGFKPVILSLPSKPSPITLEILPYGLTLHRFVVQAHGKIHDIVIGPEAPEDHITQKYTNTIVGRYANRIPVGSHVLERNGIQGEFRALANESSRVSLHGGPIGFDSLTWDALSPITTATLFTEPELAHFRVNDPQCSNYAIFRLISPDGDQGFPGKLVIEALVALIAPEMTEKLDHSGQRESNLGSIIIVYRARLDEDRKIVTPVNLTQHWGFNLEASLPNTNAKPASVSDHTLKIKARRFAKFDSDALYAGSLSAFDHPEHNHSTGKRIGDLSPQRGYDDFYFLENNGAEHIPSRFPLSSLGQKLDFLKNIISPLSDYGRGHRPDPVAELSCAKSGIKLVFDTNQHGVMFYTNIAASPERGARKKIHGGSGISGHGDSYEPGTAAFLEFHEPLAAFLDPRNKNEEDTLLTTDEVYDNYVRCDVITFDSID